MARLIRFGDEAPEAPPPAPAKPPPTNIRVAPTLNDCIVCGGRPVYREWRSIVNRRIQTRICCSTCGQATASTETGQLIAYLDRQWQENNPPPQRVMRIEDDGPVVTEPEQPNMAVRMCDCGGAPDRRMFTSLAGITMVRYRCGACNKTTMDRRLANERAAIEDWNARRWSSRVHAERRDPTSGHS